MNKPVKILLTIVIAAAIVAGVIYLTTRRTNQLLSEQATSSSSTAPTSSTPTSTTLQPKQPLVTVTPITPPKQKPSTTPTATNASPSSATAGTSIEVNGSNFSPTSALIYLTPYNGTLLLPALNMFTVPTVATPSKLTFTLDPLKFYYGECAASATSSCHSAITSIPPGLYHLTVFNGSCLGAFCESNTVLFTVR